MIKKFGIIFQAEEEEGRRVREYLEHNPKTKMIQQKIKKLLKG